MKSFLKVIAVVITCVAGVVAIGAIIDVLYSKTTKYFCADNEDCDE